MMQKYKVELPDKRVLTIEAPDEQTALQDADAWFAQNSGPKTSATGAFLTGLGQGVGVGFGDEIEAGIRAALDPNRTYSDVLPEVRQRVADSAREHPLAYYGGEIGGAVAVPGGLAKVGIQGAIAKASGQGLGAAVKAGAKEGAAYGAAYGAGKSEGGIQERIEGAAGGALLGGGIGGVAPVVIGGLSHLGGRLANEINAAARPTDEAARRIIQARQLDDSARQAADNVLGPTNQQVQQDAQALVNQGRAGQEMRNIDLGGENTRALMRSAANQSPEAREILQRMTGERFEGQSARTVDFLRGLVQTPGNAVASRDQLTAAARKANNPAYRAAYEAGDRPIWTQTLERLTGAPMVRKAMEDAAVSGKDRAIAEGYGAFNTRVKFEPSGRITFTKGPEGVPTFPNLQYWDAVKQELDNIVSKAKAVNDKQAVDLASGLVRTLRNELDQVVPQYASARGVAAQFFGADDALTAGELFAKGGSRYSVNEAQKAVAKMAPEERAAFQEGYVSELLTKINQTGDRRNIVGRLANSPDERKRLAIVFGPNKARELEAFLHIEQLMDLPRAALGNSTTARQLVELGLAGGAGSLFTSGSLTDPSGWILGALTRYGVGAGKQVIDQRMARNIAEMLASRDPAVFQRGVQQAAYGPTLQALRNISAAIAKGAPAAQGAMVGGAAAQSTPLTGSQMGQGIRGQ